MSVSPLIGRAKNEALRVEAASLDRQAEQQRQALQHEKHLEDQRLRKANEEHRRKVQEEAAAGKKVLDEMREVRNKMHSKLQSQRANAFNDVSAANVALARAGQRALTARGEHEHWQAQASVTESRATATKLRELEVRDFVKEATSQRTQDAKEHSEARISRSYQLTQHSQAQSRQLKQLALSQLETKELQTLRTGQLKVAQATRGADQAKKEMHIASARSGKQQMGLVYEIQRSLDAGSARISAAQRELDQQEAECKAALGREEICASQIKRVVGEMKEQAQADLVVGQGQLQQMLQQVTKYATSKKVPFEEAQIQLQHRKDASDLAADIVAVGARERAGKETEELQKRLAMAKRLVSDLQAHCAAHVSELMSRWEDAKSDYAQRVTKASQQTQELLRRCEEQRQARDQHCADSLEKNETLAKDRLASAESRAEGILRLAKIRADTMQTQSAEKRRQAEARLEQMRRHLEEVQSRCQARIEAGRETAEEKVELAKKRCAEMVKVAQQRENEALDSRDKAREAYRHVSLRCAGAADEAHCRGLVDIAHCLMPPSAISMGGALNIEAEMQRIPFSDTESRPVTGKSNFKETSSTMLPDRGSTPQTFD
eukprot:TRINITY_DN106430_c0_g1_i1.p1 TRINITY_DN106430_c0_g1~~TRINITY_DN106430_c0_g1_i1.p1  ORF type:complete len:628 (-),score=175.54 TRINITY_DN106430_c0_g1_i1:38-1855(-)